MIKRILTDRALCKALTWRLVASTETCFLGWLVTGDVTIGLSIMGIEMFSKVFLYWLHDKAWLAAPGFIQSLTARRVGDTT